MILALALSLMADSELHVAPQLSTWVELDTNAKRIPSGSLDDDGSLDPNKPRDPVVGDGLVRAEGSVASDARGDGWWLRNDSAAGLKLFFNEATERMAVVQSRSLLQASELPMGFRASLAALGKVRAQLSGARSYTLLRGDGGLEHAVPGRMFVRGGMSGQAFHAFDNPLFSSSQGSLLSGLRAQPTSAERLDVSAELGLRSFPFASRDPGDLTIDERRTDVIASAGVSATSARKVFFGVAYLLLRNASNARAESFTRHRLSAVVGFRLPERITCSAQGALQLTQYDDGVSLGQRYFLGDDEESQNVLEVQLARPIVGGVWVEARASFMGNELAAEGARFSRQTAGVGLRAEL